MKQMPSNGTCTHTIRFETACVSNRATATTTIFIAHHFAVTRVHGDGLNYFDAMSTLLVRVFFYSFLVYLLICSYSTYTLYLLWKQIAMIYNNNKSTTASAFAYKISLNFVCVMKCRLARATQLRIRIAIRWRYDVVCLSCEGAAAATMTTTVTCHDIGHAKRLSNVDAHRIASRVSGSYHLTSAHHTRLEALHLRATHDTFTACSVGNEKRARCVCQFAFNSQHANYIPLQVFALFD